MADFSFLVGVSL